MIGRVIGLDLSLTATGLAVWDGMADPQIRLHTITPPAKVGRGQRRIYYLRVAIQHACTPKPDLVVIEDLPMVHGTGATPLRLAELHGVVKHQLWSTGITYTTMTATQLKKYILGKGSGPGTGKDAVLLETARKYGAVTNIGDNNQADALVLVAAACDHYGVPIGTHRRATASVTWPNIG